MIYLATYIFCILFVEELLKVPQRSLVKFNLHRLDDLCSDSLKIDWVAAIGQENLFKDILKDFTCPFFDQLS